MEIQRQKLTVWALREYSLEESDKNKQIINKLLSKQIKSCRLFSYTSMEPQVHNETEGISGETDAWAHSLPMKRS